MIGALLAAESGLHDDYPETVASAVITLGVYWLARSYSGVLGRRLSMREHLTAGVFARALAHDWAIIRGATIPLFTLLVAWAAGATQATGVTAAVWAAIVSLIAFELLAGWRSHATSRELVLEGCIGVLMGLAILALKSLAH